MNFAHTHARPPLPVLFPSSEDLTPPPMRLGCNILANFQDVRITRTTRTGFHTGWVGVRYGLPQPRSAPSVPVPFRSGRVVPITAAAYPASHRCP